ncbi:MAG: formate dehydrogenase subunit delta [Rhodospirillales bacterium]|nr:formate dehydrogenase subunit delta [Rhodospirillales bacterium]MDE2197877.1 formate dehydrogenase subunit delta [Rhodospirillales bacterium]MDE2577065.1 formate dehydrogenase subunit delta [Rhodospirillales bacterium]
MSPDKLVMMANQISRFFASQPGGQAARQVADHILRFWEPRMRAAMLVHFAAGGVGLDPVAREAVALLDHHDPAADLHTRPAAPSG